jgi:small subunit ribosomal protein S18
MYDKTQSRSERPERSDRPDRAEGEGGFGGNARAKPFFRRRRSCPLTGPKAPEVDYKDVKLLSRYVSERGKILPSRITSVCAKKQREMSNAIKRARNLALMPYVSQ